MVQNPYISHRNIQCYYIPDDNMCELHGHTYSQKDKIKLLGGKWDSKKKCWLLHKDLIKNIKGVYVMIRVKIPAHCHMEERIIWATHKEVKDGVLLNGCSYCDTIALCGDVVPILEVIDKEAAEIGSLL